jgi:hypothetical protein
VNKYTTLDQLRQSAEAQDEHVRSVLEAVTDAIEEVAENTEKKATPPQFATFTLAKSGWKANSESNSYSYRYELAADVTADSRADAILNAASGRAACACGLCGTTETAKGIVIFRAEQTPTADLAGELRIY